MSLIKEHALERFWLERRLEYLNILDDFAEHAFQYHDCEADMSDKDPKLTMLRDYYKEVVGPVQLAETISKIYSKH